jgi:hypothetical protein
LSLITAEIEDQFLITSSLVKVLASCEARPALRLVGQLTVQAWWPAAVRWSVASNPWFELTDQGIAP